VRHRADLGVDPLAAGLPLHNNNSCGDLLQLTQHPLLHAVSVHAAQQHTTGPPHRLSELHQQAGHLTAGLAIKNPPKKPHPKKPKKKTHKKPTKNGFLGFLKFLIFYENNTNFSL
jgi:hypothetical protein